MGESFWQMESLLQYTMTLLQGPQRSCFAHPNVYISYYCNLEEEEQVHGHAKILETCSKLYVSCFLDHGQALLRSPCLDLIFSYMTYD